MTWNLTEKEVRAVLLLPAAARYGHCIKRIADEELVWSLRGPDGWILACDHTGVIGVPIWPHELYARACATGEWAACVAHSIPTDEWLDRWTSGIKRDARMVIVFPTPSQKGLLVEPDRFADDLRDAMAEYE